MSIFLQHLSCAFLVAFATHIHNHHSKTPQQVSGTETSRSFLAAGDHSPQVPQGWQKHPGDRQCCTVLPDQLRVPHGAEHKAATPGHPGGAEWHGVLPGSHSKSCPACFGSHSSPSPCYIFSLVLGFAFSKPPIHELRQASENLLPRSAFCLHSGVRDYTQGAPYPCDVLQNQEK